MARFIEAEGAVHLINPILAEFTLCGDAFDLGTDEPGYEWKTTKARIVTCDKCSAVIFECRGVRTSS